jgi:hypothetical protein
MNRRLSKESEKRMTDALEKAAALISDGMHPDEALYETCKEAGIPAGHVHLMVNAINTGCTNQHRTNHDDPLEKAAAFPLADTSKVLAKLFPDEVVSEKAAAYATVVS